MDAKEELLEKIRLAGALVGYAPIDDEPNLGEFLNTIGVVSRGVSVLPTRDVSPQATAESLTVLHHGKRAIVFVPGRHFDSFGTRHGRGGGWYDRFLSHIPKAWIRVGVAFPRQVSEVPLVRESWDEPVDYLLTQDGLSWEAIPINPSMNQDRKSVLLYY